MELRIKYNILWENYCVIYYKHKDFDVTLEDLIDITRDELKLAEHFCVIRTITIVIEASINWNLEHHSRNNDNAKRRLVKARGQVRGKQEDRVMSVASQRRLAVWPHWPYYCHIARNSGIAGQNHNVTSDDHVTNVVASCNIYDLIPF